jgi:hypothetical protein
MAAFKANVWFGGVVWLALLLGPLSRALSR